MGDLIAQGTATGLLGTWVMGEYSAQLAVKGLVSHTHQGSD